MLGYDKRAFLKMGAVECSPFKYYKNIKKHLLEILTNLKKYDKIQKNIKYDVNAF